MCGGAPPDGFFIKGQNWGFPPLHPERIRTQGYRYTIACLRHHLAQASVLRIDHLMGLHRLFWIPPGMPAHEGVYVRYRAEEFYAILALESHRHEALIVGEDLGTIRPSNPVHVDVVGCGQFGQLGNDTMAQEFSDVLGHVGGT